MPPYSQFVTNEFCSPETALWRAVVLQALDDATIPLGGYEDHHNGPRGDVRQSARDFLSNKDGDLELICAFASLDLGSVMRRAVHNIANDVRPNKNISFGARTPVVEPVPDEWNA